MRSQSFRPAWVIATALLTGACVSSPGMIPLPAGTVCPPAQPDPAVAAAEARYEAASARTADGSRAYAYSWGRNRATGWGPGVLYLLVSEGRAELFGSMAQPTTLTLEQVAPFEKAVADAGFPNFPGVEDMICNDGAPQSLRVAVGGRQASIASNACGFFGAPVYDAVEALKALAKAQGGFIASRDELTSSCPIKVAPGRLERLKRPYSD